MRLGVTWVLSSNAHYRALDPLRAMERRGHQVVWPLDVEGTMDAGQLATCDVVHVYRRSDPDTRRLMADLAGRGVAITYDNDDDLRAIPKDSPDYKQFGGLMAQRLFDWSVKLARGARVFTTTNERMAETYRRNGIERIEVIPNHLKVEISRARVPHEGVVIGWVAGVDHIGDARRLRIADALRELMARRPEVRVECIGVDLGLAERYTHHPLVPFVDLPKHIGAWDVGIAPLTDTPGNRVRSDIKLKEYAASGVPWLASPIGPYVGLGEEHGGRLVADGEWAAALERLVDDAAERQRLGRNAAAWAATQTIDAVADRWEAVFAEACGGGRPTAPAPPGRPRMVVRLPPR